MKKIVCFIGACILASCFLLSCGHQDGKEKLTVAMELDFPPFETKDTKGNPTGASIEFLEEFGAYVDKEIVIKEMPKDDLIPALGEGKADMVMSSLAITKKHSKSVDFSDPYANASLSLLVNKRSGVNSIQDLNRSDAIVAIKAGSTGQEYAEAHLKKARLLILPKTENCADKVASGQADGFIYNHLTVYRNWQSHLDTTTAIFTPFQEVERWGVAVQKGDVDLQAHLNEFLAVYKKDGGFDHLTEEYLTREKEVLDKLGFQWFFDFSR